MQQHAVECHLMTTVVMIIAEGAKSGLERGSDKNAWRRALNQTIAFAGTAYNDIYRDGLAPSDKLSVTESIVHIWAFASFLLLTLD